MRPLLTRRELLAAGVCAVATPQIENRKSKIGNPKGHPVDYSHLPRWRGFNLLEKFTLAENAAYNESDFDMLAELGFDFVRLPTDYRCWTESPGVYKDSVFKQVDQAVAWGRARKIHVNLCLHRAPGYCVNPPVEPLSLWDNGSGGEEARKQFADQWGMFATRYKGIPSAQLSFDLLNEPGDISAEVYRRAVKRAVEAIHGSDPNRLVVADGLRWGNKPVPELAALKIAQSTRGYSPIQISHFRASWMQGSDKWAVPTWPLEIDHREQWNKDRLYREQIAPWKDLQAKGVGVHVGEWGAYNRTPHDVVLAWMRDQLALWREAGWGWSMWNFRGSFGPLDSDRADVQYESWRGHKVDRKMLDLLKEDLKTR